jgi:hypothetical protein
MGVLSGLLPGFRELRAPLAAGYLYLLTVWLLIGDLVPRARPPSGPFADLWDLGGILGRTVVIAAVTFSAYLLGSFMEIDPQRLVALGRGYRLRRRLARLPFLAGEGPLSLSASADLDRLATETGIPAEYAEGVQSEVIEEMPQLATRLQVKNADIYGKYDRLVAEGTFRLNVAVPLTLFLSVLAFRSGLAWSLRVLLLATAAVFGSLLAQQGMRRVVAARDVIIQAISIPDLELESRRLKDFRWRLESIQAVKDALRYQAESGPKRQIREMVVRILRDRQDLVRAISRPLPAYAEDNPSDSELLSRFVEAIEIADDNLKGKLAGTPIIVALDQILRQLDQIDSGKRADL